MKPDSNHNSLQGRRALGIAIILWSAITLLVVVTTLWLFFARGIQGFNAIVMPGPISDLHLTLLSVAISWILIGVLIALFHVQFIDSKNVLKLAGFFAISLLYVNFLRERPLYGDYTIYVNAAVRLYQNKHLPMRYIYPPLWATLLEPLIPFGNQVIFDVLWLLNVFSLFAFYFILQSVLRKYGFTNGLATATTFAFMLINVPILRTLGFVQVNLHVTNLILLSVLYYDRSRWFSAFAMTLAVQLKMSPLLLILAFLLEKDIRWITWFVAFTLVILAGTIAINGVAPYYDLLSNLRRLDFDAIPSFRDTSIDTFFRTISTLIGGNTEWIKIAIIFCKGLLVVAALWIVALNVRYRCFYDGNHRGSVVLNAIPALLMLMMMASPLVWEHHPVFVALSYLVLLKGLSSLSDWLWFGFAYYLEFLVPTFDFFPWSFGRLISPLIWLGLVGWLTKSQWPSTMFLNLSKSVE